MSEEFDVTPYTRLPVFDVAGGVGLACGLIAACPRDAPDEVRKRARALRRSVVALQADWAKAEKVSTLSEKRPADVAVDNSWAIFRDRILAYAALPVAIYPRAHNANALVDRLAIRKLEFLKFAYPSEWAESEQRLKLIDGDAELEAECNALAGPEFLAEIRRAHHAYGEVLGLSARRPEVPAPVGLVEPLRKVRNDATRYALAVIALADESDPASLAAVRAALAPIDELREATARRARDGADEEAAPTPVTPVPDVPNDPKPVR